MLDLVFVSREYLSNIDTPYVLSDYEDGEIIDLLAQSISAYVNRNMDLIGILIQSDLIAALVKELSSRKIRYAIVLTQSEYDVIITVSVVLCTMLGQGNLLL